MIVSAVTTELPPVPPEIVDCILNWAVRQFQDNIWVYEDLEEVDDLDTTG